MASAKIEATEAPKIYAALGKVQAGLASIPKNGVMKFGNTSYEYLKADDVQDRLNPLLTENKIIVQADYTVETLSRGRGEGAPYVYVHLTLTYVHQEDGSTFPVSGVGESAATDDKSINKALTQAIKNLHRATFQFASGEREPDDTPPSSTASDTPSRAVTAAKKTPPPPRKQAQSPLRAQIKEYIDKGTLTSEEVNERVAKTGKKGDEAYQIVLDALKEEEK